MSVPLSASQANESPSGPKMFLSGCIFGCAHHNTEIEGFKFLKEWTTSLFR